MAENVEMNAGNDAWYLDQSFTIEMAKTDKSNEEYLTILTSNRQVLEERKYAYTLAILKNDALEQRANMNNIKRILNVNHFIMHKLQHNGVRYDVNKYEFERPNEIVERVTPLVKKKEGCFVTKATLLSIGKDDNCVELTLFRDFRDNWVQENKPFLIKKYYQFAPKIVEKIELQDKPDEIYEEIWKNYLSIGKDLIDKKEYQNAFILYQTMMYDLGKRFYPLSIETEKR